MSNKPQANYRIGGVSLALFVGDKGQSSYVFSKSYKQGEEWKNTQYLNRADLCVAKELICKALAADEIQAQAASASKVSGSNLGDDDIPF
jgi:hypothetical protein